MQQEGKPIRSPHPVCLVMNLAAVFYSCILCWHTHSGHGWPMGSVQSRLTLPLGKSLQIYRLTNISFVYYIKDLLFTVVSACNCTERSFHFGVVPVFNNNLLWSSSSEWIHVCWFLCSHGELFFYHGRLPVIDSKHIWKWSSNDCLSKRVTLCTRSTQSIGTFDTLFPLLHFVCGPDSARFLLINTNPVALYIARHSLNAY